MTSRPSADAVPVVGDQVRRVETSLTELNARIGVLAKVLGANLGSEADIEHILNREHAFFRVSAGHHAAVNASERRIQREWEELRGLLALRCDLMAQAVNELGLDTARQITLQVQARRDKEGLKPDSDGFHLRHRLADPSLSHPHGVSK